MKQSFELPKVLISSPSLRIVVSILAATGLILMWSWSEPQLQDPLYHQFADQRSLSSFPNVLNVLSNVPFVIVGLWGWCLIGWKSPKTPRTDSVYLAFFTGVLFTGIGSAYYHWSPDDASLVWDRLPMTVGFMSFTAMIIVERCNETVGLRLFPYLLTVGVLSVGYWTWQGDLRPYLLVQFGPMLFLPIIIWRFKGPGTRWLWATVVFYLLAKTLELFDQEIFMVTGSLVSGHALKHIAAAAGASMIIAKARVAPSF